MNLQEIKTALEGARDKGVLCRVELHHEWIIVTATMNNRVRKKALTYLEVEMARVNVVVLTIDDLTAYLVGKTPEPPPMHIQV